MPVRRGRVTRLASTPISTRPSIARELPCLRMAAAQPIGLNVLDLSQNWDVNTPGFARYDGPSIKWVKRVAFEGVGGMEITSTLHVGTHLDAPNHFVTSAQRHRRAADRLPGRPGVRRRPAEDGHRRLPDLRPRALRALGTADRHLASSAATSWSSTPATTASIRPTGRPSAGRSSRTRRATSSSTLARRASSPTGSKHAASAGWRSTPAAPTTR